MAASRPWPSADATFAAAWAGTPQPSAPVESSLPSRTAQTPPPRPPTFGYALIGRLDDGVPKALLAGPARSFGVQSGDVIDRQWRVDAVGATGITLTWLPSGMKQTVAFAPLAS